MASVVVCGAGIFGVTAALELRRRGDEVTLTDPGPVPHPDAESTDLSKAVRMDYGADEAYSAMMEDAIDGWRNWERAWVGENTPSLFHETGVLYVTRQEMKKGGFEHDSFEVLTGRGHMLERLDARSLRARFPAWSTGAYVDGYFNRVGGFAESGRVVGCLLAEARRAGVKVLEGFRAAQITDDGVMDDAGGRLSADVVVVTAGAWTTKLLPELEGHLFATAQPVFHLRPDDPALFAPTRFPTFGADIARTGFYGFPATPAGLVKIANHGPGFACDPSGPRTIQPEHEQALRDFLRATFPALENAPIAATRVCIYCDTRDEHFWIDRHPQRPNVVVATGGSGHAFKFAPLLGRFIADAVAGKTIERFRWRTDENAVGLEAARHHG
jgi:sarcosine oxidase / L-pipecolate oxidase